MTPDPTVVPGVSGKHEGLGAEWLASTQRGALIIDVQGRVIAVNAAARELLGRSEQELRAADWWLALDARTPSGVALVGHTSVGRRVMASGVPLRDQIIDIARSDGMRMWLSVDYEPLVRGDGTAGVLALSIRDLSAGLASAGRCVPTPGPGLGSKPAPPAQ